MAAGTDENGEGTENVGLGSVHEEFKPADEVRGLISSLVNIYQDQIAVETSCERFTYLIDQYQEQPHLIDPHLEGLMNQLLTIGRDIKSPPALQNLAFKYMYLITKMRGAKVVVRVFPHEVVDVEPVLALIAQQDPENYEAWETRYILLLWLMVACMIPFDLARLDSNIKSDSGEVKQPVMDRILDIGKLYLRAKDKSREAAAYLMSRFMTRPDVKKLRLPGFLDWTLKMMETAEYTTMTGSNNLAGILTMLALLFKHGKREDLLEYAPTVLESLEKLKLEDSNNTVLRKAGVKVTQRLALTFLKQRLAAWRYQRGSRSLSDNLKQTRDTLTQGKITLVTGEDEDEEYDIPDEIENIIEQLLLALKDKDTVVRWSAAKGIGRITGRLPKELADEVVGSLMDLFNLQETDGAWHGGCLALAELGRRGLLLPQRLPDVVPVVLKALTYDERRGWCSVGAHVRDAACYVCWAFARAYEPTDIANYVNQIASSLIIAALFDREVNVRRAASAAFQENVGRQGTFPHGIDILTTADYFAVGNLKNCYLELSVFVAQFPEYTISLINHLAETKISHWDSPIREVAASALHKLTVKSPEHMLKTVLPSLIPKATGTDLHLRHGAILAAAEITHALSIIGTQNKCIGSEEIEGLRDIAKKLSDAQLFRGMSGELMRKAVCCLIEKTALSKLPYHNLPVIELWQEILDDCLHHIEPDIQMAAITALPAFFNEYYMESSGLVKPVQQEKVLEKYLRELQGTVETVRCGHSLALGALPKFMVAGKLRAVLSGLIAATRVTEKEEKWAESRRDALKAIASLVCTVGVEKNGDPTCVLCASNIDQVYEAFLCAMNDYTLDSRGDVGAWVREASMTGLHDITSLIIKTDPSLFSANICSHIFKCLVQQCCEKIDRTRAHAGSVFSKLLYHSPPIPHISHVETLHQIFPQDEVQAINWAAPVDTFPRFTQLLKFPLYSCSVLLGLTVSVGGITESLVKHSSTSLQSYLRNISKDIPELTRFTESVVQIFKDYQKVDRVSLPMLKMLDRLLSLGSFDALVEEENHPFPVDVVTLVKKEIAKSRDPFKLLASADVFCGLLQFPGTVREKCLTSLSILLCHRFPRVRKTTANKLYEVLVTYDDIAPTENLEEIVNILSDTLWDNELTEIKPVRNQICDLLHIPRPVLLKQTETK